MGAVASSCHCCRDEKVVAKVVQINELQPDFPEGQTVEGNALCISGGGARALSFGLGVYRALSELGLFDEVHAISSVSGGTWLSAGFMFAKEYRGVPVDTPTLVGAPAPPGKQTIDTLQQDPAPLGAGATKNADAIILKEELRKIPADELWYRLIGAMYLKDFDLDSTAAHLAASADDVQRIVQENPCLQNARFYVPRTDRPKVFVMGCVLLAPVGYSADGKSAVALQISPNYTGYPYYPRDAKVSYKKENGDALELIAGGGLVETFAFGGAAPSPRDQSGGNVMVGRPAAPMSLARAAGISSCAPASALQYFENRRLDPTDDVWPVTSTILPGPQAAQNYNMGDGGSQDNAGLLALLQRRAKKVLWIANCYRSLSTTYDYDNATPETFDPDAAGVVEQLYDKFGYGYNKKNLFYANNKVFSKDLLLPLVKQLVELKNKGKPAVVRASFDVHANSYWGIEGGSTVEILLVYLEKVNSFEQSLPACTQAELAKGENGLFPKFPIYKTGVHLPACQVNLLAAQGEYSVMENADLFRDFLRGGTVTVPALGGA